MFCLLGWIFLAIVIDIIEAFSETFFTTDIKTSKRPALGVSYIK